MQYDYDHVRRPMYNENRQFQYDEHNKSITLFYLFYLFI